MIVCKYTKIDSAIFVPHLDILRAVIMGIRRAGLSIQYSEGFNPHMQLYFNQPLPIGVGSECEYFCAHSSENPQEFMDRLNLQLPRGVKVLKSAKRIADPKLAKVMDSALYEVVMRDIVKDLSEFKSVLERDSLIISFIQKGEAVTKEVRALIDDIKAVDNKTLLIKLKCGNLNLRADRLVNHLCKEHGISCDFDVVKKQMFSADNKNLDELLEEENL